MIVSIIQFCTNFITLADVGSFYYGEDHPMKPFRIKMAHQLILEYGLYRKMNTYVSYLNFTLINFILATKQSF